MGSFNSHGNVEKQSIRQMITLTSFGLTNGHNVQECIFSTFLNFEILSLIFFQKFMTGSSCPKNSPMIDFAKIYCDP